jgi:hypothetical protein
MSELIEIIQERQDKILGEFRALGDAAIADAEGSHRLRLTGFLRHQLLPMMHTEEKCLYGLLRSERAGSDPDVIADWLADHRFAEKQVAAINDALKAANLGSTSYLRHSSQLEALFMRLDAILRLHLRSEGRVYWSILQRCEGDNRKCELGRRIQRVYGERNLAATC